MTLADAIHSQAEKLPPEKQSEVLDFILFLQNHLKNTCPELDLEEKRQHLIRAFHQLRSSKAFDEIEDPIQWQRQLRQDRPLPGREE